MQVLPEEMASFSAGERNVCH